MLLLISKLIIGIILWFALGALLLPTLNFIGKKLNDLNEETNEIMTIATMIMVAPLFVAVPLFV